LFPSNRKRSTRSRLQSISAISLGPAGPRGGSMKLLAHISIRSAVFRNILGPLIPPGTIDDVKGAKGVGVQPQRWKWKRKSCQGPIAPALAAGANAFYRVPNIKAPSADGNRSNFSRFGFPTMKRCHDDGTMGSQVTSIDRCLILLVNRSRLMIGWPSPLRSPRI